ncbi:MAG: hypothetical protein GF355_12280 [Candidatus Eisenbacteria bacterium]|nr:hypothetical protein [Candidatus Eisenbacteria bacterium]
MPSAAGRGVVRYSTLRKRRFEEGGCDATKEGHVMSREDSIVGILLLVGLGSLTGTASSETYIVDQSGGGDFLTIQDAIDVAQDLDEILVRSGTYVENIDYSGKDLWIHSESGPDATIIDGSAGPGDTGTTVTFSGGESIVAKLEGFSVTGGHGTDYVDRNRGGGILCLNAAPTIFSCKIYGNTADGGAGFYGDNANPTIIECQFTNNSAASLGGAISNSSAGANYYIYECLFEDNSAGWGGGALHCDPCTGVIEDCEFRGNIADTGGAVSLGYGPGPSFRTCIFEDNQAVHSNGGAVRLREGSVEFEACLFVDNHADVDGGAIFATDPGAEVNLQSCTLYGNGAGRYGGNLAGYSTFFHCQNTIISFAVLGSGVYCTGSDAQFLCCDVYGNAGGDFEGGCGFGGENGNISMDPLFCNPGNGDFQLRDDSPCAPFSPPNSECDLIGALPVGCTAPTPTESVSWGRLKTTYEGH